MTATCRYCGPLDRSDQEFFTAHLGSQEHAQMVELAQELDAATFILRDEPA